MPSTPPLLREGTRKSFHPEGRSLALFTPPLTGGGEHNRVAFRTAVYSVPLGERGGEMERLWMLLLHAQPTFKKKGKAYLTSISRVKLLCEAQRFLRQRWGVLLEEQKLIGQKQWQLSQHWPGVPSLALYLPFVDTLLTDGRSVCVFHLFSLRLGHAGLGR